MSIWRKLRISFRYFRNRCIICGGKKEKHLMCYHCMEPYFCHMCGKQHHHALSYGL